jgi:kynurenine formamidase
MPYVLCPTIRPDLPGLWKEGSPYEANSIYKIPTDDPKLPPVNYSEHVLRPHSIPHVDAPSHIIPDGLRIDAFFKPEKMNAFFGRVDVVKLRGAFWKPVADLPGQYVWHVNHDEIEQGLTRIHGSAQHPEKIFLTVENLPQNEFGNHDPNYALVLTEESAEWLVSSQRFDAYGTSWKSTDFQPGSKERPIHKILFKQALLFECLDLSQVPEGSYFLSAFPLPLANATESPVCPVLFSFDELQKICS